jgi:hypothetical protein
MCVCDQISKIFCPHPNTPHMVSSISKANIYTKNLLVALGEICVRDTLPRKECKSASLPTPMRVSSYTLCVQLSDLEYINKRPLCTRQLSLRSGYTNNISRCFVTFSTYCQIYLSIQSIIIVKLKLVAKNGRNQRNISSRNDHSRN